MTHTSSIRRRTYALKLSVGALCIASAPALAATTVFGLPLGEPLRLPECPTRVIAGMAEYVTQPPVTCYHAPHKLNGYPEPARRIIFSQAEQPLIVKNWQAVALEQDGVLVGLEFHTGGVSSQDVVYRELVQKFGQPSSRYTEASQNAMGARFDVINASWDGAVVVTFYGALGKLDDGVVTIDLPRAAAARRSWQDRSGERRL